MKVHFDANSSDKRMTLDELTEFVSRCHSVGVPGDQAIKFNSSGGASFSDPGLYIKRLLAKVDEP